MEEMLAHSTNLQVRSRKEGRKASSGRLNFTFYSFLDKWKTKIESYRNWLIEDDEYCSDERLRPGKARTTESLLGIDGSFRRLSID